VRTSAHRADQVPPRSRERRALAGLRCPTSAARSGRSTTSHRPLPVEEGNTGWRHPEAPRHEQGVARTELVGPPNRSSGAAGAIRRKGRRSPTPTRRHGELRPRDIRCLLPSWTAGAQATIEIDGRASSSQKANGAKGFPFEFRVNFPVRCTHGQLFLIRADKELHSTSPVTGGPTTRRADLVAGVVLVPDSTIGSASSGRSLAERPGRSRDRLTRGVHGRLTRFDDRGK